MHCTDELSSAHLLIHSALTLSRFFEEVLPAGVAKPTGSPELPDLYGIPLAIEQPEGLSFQAIQDKETLPPHNIFEQQHEQSAEHREPQPREKASQVAEVPETALHAPRPGADDLSEALQTQYLESQEFDRNLEQRGSGERTDAAAQARQEATPGGLYVGDRFESQDNEEAGLEDHATPADPIGAASIEEPGD